MIADVDTGALLKLVWVAPLTVLIVATTWSLLVYGLTRASDHRRDDRSLAAVANVVLAAVAGLVFAATVVAGVSIIAFD